MEERRIYLAGGMGNLSFMEQNQWRETVTNYLETVECNYRVKCCNPVKYYNFLEKRYDTESEVKQFDLHKVRNSHLLIVNFNDPNSIGTAQELMLARILNIPIIGLNEEQRKLHPWLVDDCIKIFTDMKNMLEYTVEFYLT